MPRPVTLRRQLVTLPTYEPHRPDPNPMFLEKRVYQGASGRVYPLPCTDRIAEKSAPRAWQALFLENEYLLVMLLPELGGRIHRILDKTNGYDAIYHQTVIKPALVGLAGPWCSGGIEFNWPQHHRPSTFMPADVAIERHPDGAVTVWLGEHDPMARMKGMHGVRLHPGRAVVELRARVLNRTTDVQTFHWWANVATRVHEGYQSFFPPDATHVADHAKRATSTFPHATGRYYGVDYAARARHGVPDSEKPTQFTPPHCRSKSKIGNPKSKIPAYSPSDLSWYANIPVPTSYMCMGSSEDFFGGYDHKARAGLIHVADHHVAPGKKQWTWGNHAFGYAWDRNLTDPDANGGYAPYIELMAGVFTDNQPDFSFLQPGETKTWSQFWYPFRDIGPAHYANEHAALSLRLDGKTWHVGVAVTAKYAKAMLTVTTTTGGLTQPLARFVRDLAPDRPFTTSFTFPLSLSENLVVRLAAADGRTLLTYQPKRIEPRAAPPPATEPALPRDVASNDELFTIGLHLEQYRHATRRPEDYWREALRRDAGDSRCHLGLGRWHLRRGELTDAEKHLRAAIARLTSRNPNPYDGEAHYQLGRCLQARYFRGETSAAVLAEAYAAFHKATWNHAWQAAGFHALGEIDCLHRDWPAARAHLEHSLRLNTDNLRARSLLVIVLRKLDQPREASTLLAETLRLDPLDWWARHLADEKLSCDNQVRLDLAHDCVRAGLFEEALAVLAHPAAASADRPDGSLGTAPLIHYTRAWIVSWVGSQLAGVDPWSLAARASSLPTRKKPSANIARELRAATRAAPDHCFPARLEEIAVLEFALRLNPQDARAHYYLGNLLYDRRRHADAITQWERAVRFEPGNAIAWRNLGIAYHNISGDTRRARLAYERALRATPRRARYVYERDQLWKRLGVVPAQRLAALRRHRAVIAERDDLTVEYCALANQTGRPQDALALLTTRRFQPWEGGEGQVLAQYVRAHLSLGRRALTRRQTAQAISHFEQALATPENLGEARHLLANASDLHFWLGCAHAAHGNEAEASRHWTTAAEFKGDFQSMSVRAFSEMTYYSALALQRLGRKTEATRLLRQLLAHAHTLAKTKATIDYFATSLPTMLLFDDDLQARQLNHAQLMEGQALLGLGRTGAGRARLRQVLHRDPSHALAADLLKSS